MRESRNPFRLRRSENIDTDTAFLTLFEPGVLDVLSELPATVQLIRSAAGGGKTSLLRLFTPDVLRRLHARRINEQELFTRVQTLGAIDDIGPRLLGVMLLCGRNYAVLEDLPIDPPMRTRLFLEPSQCPNHSCSVEERTLIERVGVSEGSGAGPHCSCAGSKHAAC